MKQSKRFRVIGGATAIAAIALAGVGVSLSEKAGIRVLGDAPSIRSASPKEAIPSAPGPGQASRLRPPVSAFTSPTAASSKQPKALYRFLHR